MPKVAQFPDKLPKQFLVIFDGGTSVPVTARFIKETEDHVSLWMNESDEVPVAYLMKAGLLAIMNPEVTNA